MLRRSTSSSAWRSSWWSEPEPCETKDADPAGSRAADRELHGHGVRARAEIGAARHERIEVPAGLSVAATPQHFGADRGPGVDRARLSELQVRARRRVEQGEECDSDDGRRRIGTLAAEGAAGPGSCRRGIVCLGGGPAHADERLPGPQDDDKVEVAMRACLRTEERVDASATVDPAFDSSPLEAFQHRQDFAFGAAAHQSVEAVGCQVMAARISATYIGERPQRSSAAACRGSAQPAPPLPWFAFSASHTIPRGAR